MRLISIYIEDDQLDWLRAVKKTYDLSIAKIARALIQEERKNKKLFKAATATGEVDWDSGQKTIKEMVSASEQSDAQ